MLRSILVAFAAAACLFAFGSLGDFPGGALVQAGAGVALGVAVTALAYGEATWISVALGALSPLAFASLEGRSLTGATVAMCFLWLAPRFVLAETRKTLALLVAGSCTAAVVAGAIFAAYFHAPLAAHGASCVFAGACLSLVNVVVPVRTTVAYALETAAEAVDPPIRDALRRAANAHQSARWMPATQDVRGQWRALVQLADRRAALQRASGTDAERARKEIDDRIEACTAELVPLAPPASAPAAPVVSPDRPPEVTSPEGDASPDSTRTPEREVATVEPETPSGRERTTIQADPTAD